MVWSPRANVKDGWSPSASSSGGGDVAATFVEKYVVDWLEEFALNGAHDFKVDGPYTDIDGMTWSIADNTIDGDGNASAIDLTATGLVVTTGANGEITFQQFIQNLPGLGAFALTDRLAILFVATSADQTTSGQVTSCRFGDDPFTDGAHQVFRFRAAGGSETKQNRKQADPGAFDSAVVTLDAAFHAVMGFDLSGDLCLPYYGAVAPAVPFTGLTAGAFQSMMRQPNDPTAPYTAAQATFQYAVNRNSAVDYTMTWASCGVYRWE